jgi:hypothetical protein
LSSGLRQSCSFHAFAIGFVLFGIFWMSYSIQESWPQWSRTRGLLRTEGRICELIRGADGEADVLVVDYQVGWRLFRSRHKVVLSPGPYQVGEIVGVRFRADQPQDGVVDTFWENWSLVMVLGGFGLVFAAIGIGTLWYQGARARPDAEAA